MSELDLYLPEASSEGRLSSTGPAVRVQGLAKRFGKQEVLNDVSFELERGKVYSILGPSGCGKSTLLKAMIGAERPNDGIVEIDGIDVWGGGERDRARARRKFGVLFQSGALLNGLTCGENVALPLRRHTNLPESTIEMMVRLKLELVGMGHAIDKRPPELSGGMIKRCALARAIALDPAIVFYDEPSAGIDPVMIAVLDRLILDLSDKLGITSVVITHEIPSALRISDEMLMLWNGRVHYRGTPADFQASDDEVVSQFMHGKDSGPLSEGISKAAVAARVLGIDQKELFSGAQDSAQKRAQVRFEEERERRSRTASERYKAASDTMFLEADKMRKRTRKIEGDPAAEHTEYTEIMEADYLRQLKAEAQERAKRAEALSDVSEGDADSADTDLLPTPEDLASIPDAFEPDEAPELAAAQISPRDDLADLEAEDGEPAPLDPEEALERERRELEAALGVAPAQPEAEAEAESQAEKPEDDLSDARADAAAEEETAEEDADAEAESQAQAQADNAEAQTSDDSPSQAEPIAPEEPDQADQGPLKSAFLEPEKPAFKPASDLPEIPEDPFAAWLDDDESTQDDQQDKGQP